MNIGGKTQQGINFTQYYDNSAVSPDQNEIVACAEPACDGSNWIIWFTKKGDAIIYLGRDEKGGVTGEGVTLKARACTCGPDSACTDCAQRGRLVLQLSKSEE